MNPYNWFKVYHGITTDPKWRKLARKTGLPEGIIISVWIAVLEYASQQEERGSVQNFSCEDYDCCLGYEDGTCEKVFSVLSQRGLIIDNFVVNWDKRQSMQDVKRPPKTDAQRQAECRERKRQAAQEQEDDVTKCHEERDSVTECHEVTPIRGEENRIEENRIEEKREEEIREEKDPSNEGLEIDLSSSLPAGQARPVKNAILRQEDFEQWYLAYPRHEGKQSAIKAWNKAIKEKALPSVHSLLASLEWQKDLAQWQDKQFIPLPASYLNGRRWQDEKPAPRPAPMSEGQRIYETYKRWEDEFNQREAANSQAALGGNNG